MWIACYASNDGIPSAIARFHRNHSVLRKAACPYLRVYKSNILKDCILRPKNSKNLKNTAQSIKIMLKYTANFNSNSMEGFMEEAKNISNQLLEGVNALVEALQQAKDENQSLRQQIVLLKAEAEAKNSEITTLYDEIGAKERELEEVLNKIQNALGR
ncbi:hypothetical protein [Helicobacter sp.]|uniref:hypothetical protein n=1 Tax=Helicobacter sp. TaxID=218 RepID=UPI0025C511D9|nr:hypothetical protein [Helicobacter sp.]MCI5632761.1 hypothetical protein [Helicobacter sp.]MDY5556869.1 hypothetical protein [Helicobacter sp.]